MLEKSTTSRKIVRRTRDVWHISVSNDIHLPNAKAPCSFL